MRSEVEVLLAVDLDDPTDYEQFWCHSVTRVERRGYARLHEYYNLLAKQAEGDWLLIWNDDAVMLTEGWDQIIESYPQTKVLAPRTHEVPLITFPVVPRRFVEACGHYAENLHADTWWQQLARTLGIDLWIDVQIEHSSIPQAMFGGNTAEMDSVYRERVFRLHEVSQPPLKDVWERDVEIVRSLIG